MDLKEKLYNYEAAPPDDGWNKIESELNQQDHKVTSISGGKKKSRMYLYAVSAAASVTIILSGVFFLNRHSGDQSLSSSQAAQVTLPDKKIRDSINLNNKILREIIASTEDKNLLALNYEYSLKGRKYLTVAGSEGQPVKISPKAALLIESADNEFPPKPVWNKKVDQWQQIMLSSTFSPTSTTLLDIFQMPVANDE